MNIRRILISEQEKKSILAMYGIINEAVSTYTVLNINNLTIWGDNAKGHTEKIYVKPKTVVTLGKDGITFNGYAKDEDGVEYRLGNKLLYTCDTNKITVLGSIYHQQGDYLKTALKGAFCEKKEVRQSIEHNKDWSKFSCVTEYIGSTVTVDEVWGNVYKIKDHWYYSTGRKFDTINRSNAGIRYWCTDNVFKKVVNPKLSKKCIVTTTIPTAEQLCNLHGDTRWTYAKNEKGEWFTSLKTDQKKWCWLDPSNTNWKKAVDILTDPTKGCKPGLVVTPALKITPVTQTLTPEIKKEIQPAQMGAHEKPVTVEPTKKPTYAPALDGFNADSDGNNIPDYLQANDPQLRAAKTKDDLAKVKTQDELNKLKNQGVNFN